MMRTTLILTLLAAALGARRAIAPDVGLADLAADAPNWIAELTERND